MKLTKRLFLIFAACILITALTSCSLFGGIKLPGSEADDCKLYSEHKFENRKAEAEFLLSEADCTSPAVYYTSCDCGARSDKTFTVGDALGHAFTKYFSNRNATCLSDATETAKCDRCPELDTRTAVDTALGHSFVNYVSEEDATCGADGHKTAKCERCVKTDRIIDEGSALGHSFINYVSEKDATCGADGHKTAKCERCVKTDRIIDEGSMLPHTFNTEYSFNQTHHWYGAVCIHNVKDGEEKHTFVNKTCTDCEYPQPEAFIESIGDAEIHGTQISILTKADTLADVLADTVCSAGAEYIVCSDAECSSAIDISRALSDGYNTVYIKVTSADGAQSLIYTVTVYKSFSVTVTYINDGVTVHTATADSGFVFASEHAAEDKSGYTFDAWMLGQEAYTARVLYGDIILTAGYTANSYRVTLDPNGGTVSKSELTAVYGEYTELPSPARDGYRFDGWEDAEGKAYPSGIWQTAGDTALIARWSLIPEADIISIKDALISNDQIDITVKGESFGDALTDVVCSEGASYALYSDAECTSQLDADTLMQNGLNVIYIKVTASDGSKTRIYTASIYKSFAVTVTYKAEGNTLTAVTVDSGFVFTPEYLPQDKTGYTFDGWMLGEAKYTPTVILGDITLDASYVLKTYTITLDPNGGNVAKTEITVRYGEKYTLFTPAKGLDYSFEGWVDENGNKVSLTGTWVGSRDVTLTATWRKRVGNDLGFRPQ